METRYADVQNKLNEFKESSEDGWQELKDGLEEAFNELEAAIEDAQNKFNS